MELELKRFFEDRNTTLGTLSIERESPTCFTCEDQHQEYKIPGETRIPAGRYEIKYRNAGNMVKRYKKRYPWHSGMLHLQDVPGFKYIYIHTGNYQNQTEGCILVGMQATMSAEVEEESRSSVGRSRDAYAIIYNKVALHLDDGGRVFITISDGL